MSHKGVDGRGQYGNKVGNSLRRQERDKLIGEEGGCSAQYRYTPRSGIFLPHSETDHP